MGNGMAFILRTLVNRDPMMLFEGKISVNVPPEKTWDFVLDIGKFSSCMPGLDKIDQIDDRTFDGVISAKVGPISGHFDFRSSIVESQAQESLKVKIEGKDSVTSSSLTANVDARLERASEEQTDLTYRAEVEIKGRLAILGDMIIRATASLILDEFAKRLRAALEADP